MAYSVFGKVVDGQNIPIPFALVFTSDANGKPLTPSKNTQTDDNGKWKLDGLNDTDYITVRMVGLKPQTFLAKTATSIPVIGMSGVFQRVVATTLKPDESANLKEIEIVSPKYVPPKPKPNYLLYTLVGGLLLLVVAGTIYYVNKNKK
jgi:hypothetical protein